MQDVEQLLFGEFCLARFFHDLSWLLVDILWEPILKLSTSGLHLLLNVLELLLKLVELV